MHPSIEKYRRFVDLIYKKTVSKDLIWKLRTDGLPIVEIGSNYLVVFEAQNENREDLIVFELLTSALNRADIFNDEDLIANNDRPQNFENWFLLCKAILGLAYRNATGADEVLDAMISELDDEIPF